jgi:hypothetical protein
MLADSKDTIREFRERLTEYKPLEDQGAQDEDGDQEHYDENEHRIVCESVASIQHADALLKASMQIVSEVANRTVISSETSTEPGSVWLWVEEVFFCSGQVGNAITDLGAELYPPLDTGSVCEQLLALIACMHALRHAVCAESFASGDGVGLSHDALKPLLPIRELEQVAQIVHDAQQVASETVDWTCCSQAVDTEGFSEMK